MRDTSRWGHGEQRCIRPPAVTQGTCTVERGSWQSPMSRQRIPISRPVEPSSQISRAHFRAHLDRMAEPPHSVQKDANSCIVQRQLALWPPAIEDDELSAQLALGSIILYVQIPLWMRRRRWPSDTIDDLTNAGSILTLAPLGVHAEALGPAERRGIRHSHISRRGQSSSRATGRTPASKPARNSSANDRFKLVARMTR